MAEIRDTWTCPAGHEVTTDFGFCPEDGRPRPSSAVRCSAERIGRAQRQQRVRFAGDDRANAASADVDPRWSEVPAAEPLEDSDHHRHRGRRPRHRRRRWCCPSSGEKPLTESGFW